MLINLGLLKPSRGMWQRIDPVRDSCIFVKELSEIASPVSDFLWVHWWAAFWPTDIYCRWVLNHVKKVFCQNSNISLVSGIINMAAPLLFMIFDKLIFKALAEVGIWKLEIAWDQSKSAWLSFEDTLIKIWRHHIKFWFWILLCFLHVRASPGQAKKELLFWSQREVLLNLMCHPVLCNKLLISKKAMLSARAVELDSGSGAARAGGRAWAPAPAAGRARAAPRSQQDRCTSRHLDPDAILNRAPSNRAP